MAASAGSSGVRQQLAYARAVSAGVVAGLAATVALAAPAHAARWDGRDPVGDAPAAAVDIRRVTVWNGDVNLVTRLRFVDLRKNRVGGVGLIIDTAPRQGQGYAVTVRWSGAQRRFVPRFYGRPDAGDAVSTRLRGARDGDICPHLGSRQYVRQRITRG